MIFGAVELYNVRERLPRTDGPGWRLGRLPTAVRETLDEDAQGAALTPSGGEIRFNLAGDAPVSVTLLAHTPVLDAAEVWRGPFAESVHALGSEPVTLTVRPVGNLLALTRAAREQSLPFDPALVRILLPHGWSCEMIEVQGETTLPRPDQAPASRLLTYGSSITQGGSAAVPSGTYARRTADLLGRDLMGMGTSGTARMDVAVADFLGGSDEWDCAVLELGVNVVGRWPVDEFARRVQEFVGRVARSGRPVFVIDIFTQLADWDDASSEHLVRVNQHRDAVREVVAALSLPHLWHLSGRSLLASASGLNGDGIHPSPTGHAEIALNLAREIAARL